MQGLRLAVLAALMSASSTSAALDPTAPAPTGVMFFYSIPLDARSPKEQVSSFGLAMQGRRHAFRLDNQFVERLDFGEVGGFGVKWLVVGGVAVAAAVAAGSGGSGGSSSTQATSSGTTGGTSGGTSGGTTGGTSGGTGGTGSCPPTPCPQ